MTTWQIIGLIYMVGFIGVSNFTLIWLKNESHAGKYDPTTFRFASFFIGASWPLVTILIAAVLVMHLILLPSKLYMRTKK